MKIRRTKRVSAANSGQCRTDADGVRRKRPRRLLLEQDSAEECSSPQEQQAIVLYQNVPDRISFYAGKPDRALLCADGGTIWRLAHELGVDGFLGRLGVPKIHEQYCSDFISSYDSECGYVRGVRVELNAGAISETMLLPLGVPGPDYKVLLGDEDDAQVCTALLSKQPEGRERAIVAIAKALMEKIACRKYNGEVVAGEILEAIAKSLQRKKVMQWAGYMAECIRKNVEWTRNEKGTFYFGRWLSALILSSLEEPVVCEEDSSSALVEASRDAHTNLANQLSAMLGQNAHHTRMQECSRNGLDEEAAGESRVLDNGGASGAEAGGGGGGASAEAGGAEAGGAEAGGGGAADAAAVDSGDDDDPVILRGKQLLQAWSATKLKSSQSSTVLKASLEEVEGKLSENENLQQVEEEETIVPSSGEKRHLESRDKHQWKFEKCRNRMEDSAVYMDDDQGFQDLESSIMLIKLHIENQRSRSGKEEQRKLRIRKMVEENAAFKGQLADMERALKQKTGEANDRVVKMKEMEEDLQEGRMEVSRLQNEVGKERIIRKSLEEVQQVSKRTWIEERLRKDMEIEKLQNDLLLSQSHEKEFQEGVIRAKAELIQVSEKLAEERSLKNQLESLNVQHRQELLMLTQQQQQQDKASNVFLRSSTCTPKEIKEAFKGTLDAFEDLKKQKQQDVKRIKKDLRARELEILSLQDELKSKQEEINAMQTRIAELSQRNVDAESSCKSLNIEIRSEASPLEATKEQSLNQQPAITEGFPLIRRRPWLDKERAAGKPTNWPVICGDFSTEQECFRTYCTFHRLYKDSKDVVVAAAAWYCKQLAFWLSIKVPHQPPLVINVNRPMDKWQDVGLFLRVRNLHSRDLWDFEKMCERQFLMGTSLAFTDPSLCKERLFLADGYMSGNAKSKKSRYHASQQWKCDYPAIHNSSHASAIDDSFLQRLTARYNDNTQSLASPPLGAAMVNTGDPYSESSCGR